MLKEAKKIAEDSMGHDNTHRQLKEELSKDSTDQEGRIKRRNGTWSADKGDKYR
jgi:hypothetical protein